MSPTTVAVASGAAMALLMALNAWSLWDVRRRVRRAHDRMREAMRQDTAMRSALNEPIEITQHYADWRDLGLKVTSHMGTQTADALRAALKEELRGLAATVKVEVHPLPASATLRAAMEKAGTDPMLQKAQAA